MVLTSEHEQVKMLLKDTITLLCRNGISFKEEFSIAATIGITVDHKDVVLVSINEIVQSEQQASKSGDESRISNAKTSLSSQAENRDAKQGQVKGQRSPRKKRRLSNADHNNVIINEDCSLSPDNDDTALVTDDISQIDSSCKAEPDSEPFIVKEEEVISGWSDEHNGGYTEVVLDSSGVPLTENIHYLPEQTAHRASESTAFDVMQDPVEVTLDIHSSSEGNFQCERRGWSSNTSSNHKLSAFPALSHIPLSSAAVMSLEGPLICHFCKKAFTSTEELIDHRASEHVDRSPYKYFCPHCGKGYTCTGNLKGHINSHHTRKPFQCFICHKQFGYKHHLNRHLKEVHRNMSRGRADRLLYHTVPGQS